MAFKQKWWWWGRYSFLAWNNHIFAFIPIECEMVGAGPVPNFINIILELSKVFRWVDDSKQQHIICIQGHFGAVSEADLGKIVNIDPKKKGIKNKTLWYSRNNRSRQRRLTIKHWVRLARYPLTQRSMWSLKPRFSSFFSRGKWGTLSKAFR